MPKEVSGPERAAIFLMSLGVDGAAKIMAQMDEREIQTIGNHMSGMSEIETETMSSVRKEFYNQVAGGVGGLGVAGLDFLKNTLMRALDPDKAAEILNNISTPDEEALEGGLETVRMLDPRTISTFLVNEHPQTAAIIMAHLDPPVASNVLREMPEKTRMEIVHRLATLDKVTPLVIRQLDEALQEELRTSMAAGSKMGGVENAAKIMGTLDRETETNILTELDDVDKDLAEEIRKLRFVFEDILKVDDAGIQTIMKDIAQEDLIIAMKTASKDLKEKFLDNMSERAAMMLKEDLEALGPKKLSEVEAAQTKIIDVCKKLEEEGKIVVGGGEGEDQYV